MASLGGAHSDLVWQLLQLLQTRCLLDSAELPWMSWKR